MPVLLIPKVYVCKVEVTHTCHALTLVSSDCHLSSLGYVTALKLSSFIMGHFCFIYFYFKIKRFNVTLNFPHQIIP